MATTLTVVNSLTLSPAAGFSVTGTGTLSKTGNGGTLTSNGKTWSGGIQMPSGGGFSTTFGDNWTITGNFTATPASTTVITATAMRTITIGGNLSSTTGVTCTNITFVMGGTGTISGTYTGNSTSGFVIQINSTGAVTQSTLSISTGTFTYTTAASYTSTGALSAGGSGLIINNVSEITFNSVAFLASGGQSITLNSNMNVSGALTISSTAGAINGAFTIYVGGNITPGAGISGTATIEMNGSSNVSISAGSIQNNLTINKSGGATVTLPTGGTITWGAAGRVLQLTSGSATLNPSTSTVAIPNSISVTVSGMTFWNWTVPGASTVTQNTANTIQNNLTLGSNGNVTFAGTAGWTCANLLCSTANRTITLQNSITYTTTGSASLIGAFGSAISMTSNDANLRAIWTLRPGATQDIIYVNGTRIDSSGGQTIWTLGGTTNSTLNWNTGEQPREVAYTYII